MWKMCAFYVSKQYKEIKDLHIILYKTTFVQQMDYCADLCFCTIKKLKK